MRQRALARAVGETAFAGGRKWLGQPEIFAGRHALRAGAELRLELMSRAGAMNARVN
jgi:hypothetical protein